MFALVLGVIGSLIALAAAVVMIWLGAPASGVVDGTVDRIDVAVERLDTRLAEMSDALTQLDGLNSSAQPGSPTAAEASLKAHIQADLDAMRSVLSVIDQRIDNAASSLCFWIRVSAA